MSNKGRKPLATPADWLSCWQRWQAGESLRCIGQTYGVTNTTIWKWKDKGKRMADLSQMVGKWVRRENQWNGEYYFEYGYIGALYRADGTPEYWFCPYVLTDQQDSPYNLPPRFYERTPLKGDEAFELTESHLLES